MFYYANYTNQSNHSNVHFPMCADYMYNRGIKNTKYKKKKKELINNQFSLSKTIWKDSKWHNKIFDDGYSFQQIYV